MAMVMAMVMGEISMTRKRNSLIFLTAFGLLLTGCSKSGLEITKSDILEVARDDANATKSECENVSIKEQKGSYIVSFNTMYFSSFSRVIIVFVFNPIVFYLPVMH